MVVYWRSFWSAWVWKVGEFAGKPWQVSAGWSLPRPAPLFMARDILGWFLPTDPSPSKTPGSDSPRADLRPRQRWRGAGVTRVRAGVVFPAGRGARAPSPRVPRREEDPGSLRARSGGSACAEATGSRVRGLPLGSWPILLSKKQSKQVLLPRLSRDKCCCLDGDQRARKSSGFSPFISFSEKREQL